MTFNDFMKQIVDSEPSDWIYDDSKSTYIFKPNIQISIVGKEMDYSQSGLFYEDWAMDFPDNKARRMEFELCYNGNDIETFNTVYVDGLRMAIPYPNLGDMSITQQQYKIGKIVNIPNESYGFDSYLERANITVK